MSEFKVNTITNRDGSYVSTGMWYHYLWKFWYAITKWIPTEFRGGRGRGIFAGGSQQPSGSQ